MAGVTGLEPAASGVTGRRSNQLSYTPVVKRLRCTRALLRCQAALPDLRPQSPQTAKIQVLDGTGDIAVGRNTG